MAITIGTAVKRGQGFPVNQPRDQFSGRLGQETGSRTIRIEYDPASDGWFANVPIYGTAHPTADWLIFDSYSLSPVGNGLADLVLNYVQTEFSATYDEPGLPDDEVTEDASTERVHITQHPDFHTTQAGWSNLAMADFYDWGAQRICHLATLPTTWVDASGKEVPCPNAGTTVPAEIRGMSDYLVGTGTVTVVEWSYNEPSNPIPDAGKRGVPTGYSGTADYWLIISGSRRRAGAYWQRVLTYQYSAKAISGVVYDDA